MANISIDEKYTCSNIYFSKFEIQFDIVRNIFFVMSFPCIQSFQYLWNRIELNEKMKTNELN